MKYTITKHDGIYSINQTEIKETIFNEELFNYRIIEREEIINDLIGWIAEGNKDKELMISDLKYLITLNDIYLFSSIETNEYVLKSDNEKNFIILCDELLELNQELEYKNDLELIDTGAFQLNKTETKLLLELPIKTFDFLVKNCYKVSPRMWGCDDKHYNETYYIKDVIVICEGFVE